MAETTQGIPLPDEPPKAPELLQERKWFGTPTDGLLLDFAKPYTPPKWTLTHNGISFAKRGDLHIVGGKAGHGKTAFMSQIMASILCGQFGGLTCEIEDDPSVLYIDTEQSEDDTIAIKNRVCTLANLDYRQPQERFKVARLRDTTQATERYKQILQLIWDIRPTVVFIDGLLDIVNDYNEQGECSLIIRELMTVSTYMNMSMWCVLHENPMTDKLVGSLGSIAERKVTEVFIIRKHKGPHTDKRFKDFPKVFFEVKQTKARGKDQDDWYFIVEDRALGWGVPIELDGNGSTEEAKELTKEANERFERLPWTSSGLSRTDIDDYLYKQGVTSNRQRSDLINIATEKGIIYKSGTAQRPKYHFNGLNKKQPNDTSETLPFDGPSKDEAPY